MERLPAAATAAIAALFIGRVRPPQPQEYDHHDLHNLHELHKTKCALDKLRFELTLYGFFSKQKCDLIVSIVWRSWRSWRSRWGQRWFAWRLTTSDLILTSIWTSTTSRQWRQYDLFFVSRKKSVQCKLRSFLGSIYLDVNIHSFVRKFLPMIKVRPKIFIFFKSSKA